MKLLYPGDSKEVQDRLNDLSYDEISKQSGMTYDDSLYEWIRLYYQPQLKYEMSYNSDALYGIDQVEFNPTDLCNRKCWMCPRADPEVWPNNNQHLSIETHKKICDDLGNHQYCNSIMWSGWGEPTLNPNILEMVAYTRDVVPLANQRMITNGDNILKKPEFLDELISAGITYLQIDVYDGDEQLIKFLKIIKSSKLKETINIVLSRKYKLPGTPFGTRNGTLNPYIHKEIKPSHSPCHLLLKYAFINFDGHLIYCCHDWGLKNGRVADLSKNLLSEVWHKNPELVHSRKKLLESRHNVQGCVSCDARGGSPEPKKLKELKLKNLL
jgi:hypothetical protein